MFTRVKSLSLAVASASALSLALLGGSILLSSNANAKSPYCKVNWVNGDCGTTTNSGGGGWGANYVAPEEHCWDQKKHHFNKKFRPKVMTENRPRRHRGPSDS